jgi:hypothetical protein
MTGIIWVWDIFGNASKSGIVIYTTRPNLRKCVSIWLNKRKKGAYGAILVDEKRM